MNGPLLLAFALAWAGCASFYLASPNQRWRTRPWPAKPARAAAAVLLLASLLTFGQLMQATAAAFVFATCLMLTFAVLPYLGALSKLPGGR
jgi:hypothetical protein